MQCARRQFLQQAGLGIGSLAFSALAHAAPAPAAKAKYVIWLYMDGGISHLDTFDPKPRLTKDHGKPFPMKIEATQFDSGGPILSSPWKFAPHGQSGLPISTLFPHLSKHADRLAIIRSMTNESAIHAAANYWMHTGWGTMGRPSVGAWVNYGLGSANENLPGFVVLNAGLLPTGGMDNYKPGFLPAKFSPSILDRTEPAMPNVKPAHPQRQAQQLAFLAEQDRAFAGAHGSPDVLNAAIKNYELAARLQTAIPELLDLAGESKATQQLYGLEASYPHTRTYARQCLLARRLVQRGVRFVALTVPRVDADNRWDAHGNLKKNHTEHAQMVDQPIAALLTDLQATGLWKDTLVVFATEFGRTPFTQGSDGRDHNQFGFSVWLAGGAIKGGTLYGATDEFGYKVIENKCQIHDLHATLLHTLGLDHTQLTYRFGGRDYRLTDVHGQVVQAVLA
jgi:hypothetical protein